MSASFEGELAREEARGRAAGEDAIAAVESRALARLARGRTMRRGLVVGVSAAVVGIAAWAITSTTEPSTLAAPGSPMDAATAVPSPAPEVSDLQDQDSDLRLAGGDLTAEALIASASPRTLGEEPESPRQAALLCDTDATAYPWNGASATEPTAREVEACEAVWVGDGLVLAPEFADARMLSRVGEDGATVVLDWLLQWVDPGSATALTVDEAAITVTLATDQDTLSAPAPRIGDAYVGESLWVSPTRRLAVLGGATSPRTMSPEYAALVGGVELATAAPGEALHSEQLWAIASGEVVPQVVLQVRIPPAGGAASQELILELEIVPDNRMWGDAEVAGLSAEALMVGVEPRSRDDAADPDRQAASVCELAHAAWSGTAYFGPDWSPVLDAVECEPVWLGRSFFASAPRAEDASEGMPATYVQWLLTNTTDDAVRAGIPLLLVETRPERDATPAALTVFDSLAATPSAWTEDGRRIVPLSDMFGGIMTQHVQAGAYLANAANISVESRLLGPERDPARVLRSVRNGAQATALVPVPFGDDASRVLVLEVPMGDTLRGSP
ncbi:hypothetical protein QQX09_13915 [Demequina sp. SYSU T00192]|uniref:Uncharacterized protein n=1 Tax=Demequina litoralis TaxID=3051660 RepID=A0ABT8GCT0_9MICO|nr:hypothetical protein [Demequina sp. SYSU T00192]MDN4476951.1 hypothetical protein [Demequina sp. SYSU T00192]